MEATVLTGTPHKSVVEERFKVKEEKQNMVAERLKAKQAKKNKVEKGLKVKQVKKNMVEKGLEAKQAKKNMVEKGLKAKQPKKNMVERRLKAKQAKQKKRDEEIEATGSQTVGNKTAQQQSREDNSTYNCLVCGENHEEAWIQCKTCKLWAHEDCADLNDSQHYFCDNCSDAMHTKGRKLKKYS